MNGHTPVLSNPVSLAIIGLGSKYTSTARIFRFLSTLDIQVPNSSMTSPVGGLSLKLPVQVPQWRHLKETFGAVADLEGVRVVRLNPPLGPNYFNFMGKFIQNKVKY